MQNYDIIEQIIVIISLHISDAFQPEENQNSIICLWFDSNFSTDLHTF